MKTPTTKARTKARTNATTSQPGKPPPAGKRRTRRVTGGAVRRRGPAPRRTAAEAAPSPAASHAPEATAKTARTTTRAPRLRQTLARPARAARHAPALLVSRFPSPPRWWPAAVCVLLGALLGGTWGLLRTPQYTATSYVAVVPEGRGDPVTALGFAQAYGRIATGAAVLRAAHADAGMPVATLRGSVRAVTSPDAPLIEVTGRSARPGDAARAANAVAASLTEVANDAAQATGVELSVFSRALAPRSPSSASAGLTCAVGASGGVLVGALVLLVRSRRPGGVDADIDVGEVRGPAADPNRRHRVESR